jgi:cell filamentation protein
MKDQYVYPGTNVLKNKLHIKDYDRLEYVEKEITSVRLHDVFEGILSEGLFDILHFKQFHQHIFCDIYSWAGEFRKINILKHEEALNGYPLEYMDYNVVEDHLEWVLAKMRSFHWATTNDEEKVCEMARLMSEIWRAHPFREGNTRTTITFICEFMKDRNIPLEKELFARNAVYVRKAFVASVFEDEELEKYRDYSFLEKILRDAMYLGKKNKHQK